MSKSANNQQFDTDILQCKADIVRARNTKHILNNTCPKNSEPQNNNTETIADKIPVKEIPATPRPAASIKQETGISEKTVEIPSFDLAEEIMAEQRKITSIRRKAPDKKTEIEKSKPKVQAVDHTIKQLTSSLSEQEKVIAEIVARDIEKLCQG